MEAENQPQTQWVALAATRNLWRQSRQAADDLPGEAWRQWLKVAGIGWIISLVVMLCMTLGMQTLLANGFITKAQETQWVKALNDFSPMTVSEAVWMSAPGDPIVIIPVLILGAIIAIRMGYPLRAASILAAYFLVAAIVWAGGWMVWDRSRPDIVLDGVAAPGLHSFPSGHMAEITSTYMLFWYFWLRRSSFLSERLFGILLLIVWVGMVGVARVELGTHWVTDVIAGTIIGAVWCWALIMAMNKAEALVARTNLATSSQSTSGELEPEFTVTVHQADR